MVHDKFPCIIESTFRYKTPGVESTRLHNIKGRPLPDKVSPFNAMFISFILRPGTANELGTGVGGGKRGLADLLHR